MTVHIGTASAATAGVDAALGEMEIPPPPPTGVFDVRLLDPDTLRRALGEGVWLDLQPECPDSSDISEHLLVCQCGSSTELTIAWSLPPGSVAILTASPGVTPQRIVASGTDSIRIAGIVTRYSFAITLHRNVRTLTARVFLEGPFDRTTARMRTTLRDTGILANHFADLVLPAMAVDSIAIVLHDSSSPGASHVRIELPAWLLADGTACPFQPPFDLPLLLHRAPLIPLFLSVRHRNHLPVRTAQPLDGGPTALYADMAARAEIVADGQAALLSPGIFGMIAGDTDSDGQIGSADLCLIRSDIGCVRGYTRQDVDMNSGVGATDLALVRRVMAVWMRTP